MIRPTQARIDPEALRDNIRAMRNRLRPGTRMMAIVKADCYGHGVEHCVPTMRAEGIDLFGVATVEEGQGLREFGVTERVVVLPPPLVGQYGMYPRYDLEALISDRRTAEALAAAARSAGRPIRAHLHVDTGMTRNGAAPHEALELARLAEAIDGVEIVGIASHFATSDDSDTSYARLQHERFEGVLRMLADAGITYADVHLSNSGGVLNFPDAQYTIVRPGLALYGYHPARDEQHRSELRPIMSLHTVIGGIKRVEPETSVSYGRTWTTRHATMIATLPIGYADGLLRALSNRLDVLIDGVRYPAVGRISMDETMIDLGPTTTLRPGAAVVVIGRSGSEEISAWDLADAAGTIPYEICTNISSRVPRCIWGAGEPSPNSSTK